MSNKRMITSDLFEDDICSESYFTRLLWIGIITAVADDQGRMLDNPAIMRARIFPLDNEVTDKQIIESLEKIGKSIHRYSSKDGKKLIQIVKWWSYQTPSWASPSRFDAPTGWIDRIKVHVIGNTIRIENWDKEGGFLRSKLPINQGRAIEESEVKSESDDEIESESEPDAPLPDPISPIQRMVEEITGKPPSGFKDIQAMDELEKAGVTREDIQGGYQWYVDQGNTFNYYGSIVKPSITAMNKRIQAAHKPNKAQTIADKNNEFLKREMEKEMEKVNNG